MRLYPEPSDLTRTSKLSSHFLAVLSGDRTVTTTKQAEHFIDGLCAQVDPPACVEKIISAATGLSSLQACLRCDISPQFINGPATRLLEYLSHQSLELICGGDYLRQIVLQIAEPPIFWNALLLLFRQKKLQQAAQERFAWLLLKLICLDGKKGAPFIAIARELDLQASLLASTSRQLRALGQRITHILSSLSPGVSYHIECGPGGRHDNDFVDFRKIGILPTADELTSEDPPFLRTSEAMDDPGNHSARSAIYLDNQFRLLREDMLAEMREEIQILMGTKKARRKCFAIQGFTIFGLQCGKPARREAWKLQLECASDWGFLAGVKPMSRKTLLEEKRNFLRHQSLACLLIDGGIVAFPTIYRDVDLLARNPPVITLEIKDTVSAAKTLLLIKSAQNIKLMQIETGVFSYEPVLKGLQNLKDFPLAQEILFSTPEQPAAQVTQPPEKITARIDTAPFKNLQDLLDTRQSIILDESQARSLMAGLKQKLSLIQGPPGTGKSFIGALIAKSLYKYSDKKMLVVCYTNHALDQFLEELLDIGIPKESMVRLGGKSTDRTKPLSLYDQTSSFKRNPAAYKIIDDLRMQANLLADRLEEAFAAYRSASISKKNVHEHLEFEEERYYDAFLVPSGEGDMTRVGKKGKSVNELYLLDRWIAGQDAGMFQGTILPGSREIWSMDKDARNAALAKWKSSILHEQVSQLCMLADDYNTSQSILGRRFEARNEDIIAQKRIIGCTTTAAAKYTDLLQANSRDVVIVEEAGEILESHIITALASQTEQLILIGDHEQLRPKVHHSLSVEKGDGYDLNRSLFERLVLKGYPHQTLVQQHRMRPEISSLIRTLTYPALVDDPKTQNRPNLRGCRDNVIFVSHSHPEDDEQHKARLEDASTSSSKRNEFEATMVVQCVRYLAQQGYGTEKVVVLTAYLAQLSLLSNLLSKSNDPILNDLDSFDLVRAGLRPAASAGAGKRSIYISTIDNYQGEEKDIVIVSLTRSNDNGDIGFLSQPERLNVLLSRARNALIMIGNAGTFLKARKGKTIWHRLFEQLLLGEHVYDGLPVKCERHPDRIATLREPIDFENECPDGGCQEPCNSTLNCGLHRCPQKCHQLSDHSKMDCEYVLSRKCDKGHGTSWKCHKKPPAACAYCERVAKEEERKKKKALERQQKREREELEHAKKMEELTEKLEQISQNLKDQQLSQERQSALQQKRKDIENALNLTKKQPQVIPQPYGAPQSASQAPQSASQAPQSASQALRNSSQAPQSASQASPKEPHNKAPESRDSSKTAFPTAEAPDPSVSASQVEWQRQKSVEKASNSAIDSIMEMTGLEEVKAQVLRIKAKIDVNQRQGSNVKDERFNVSLLGNPGTGKTTIARLYAETLTSLELLPGTAFVETTGSRLANDGVAAVKKHIEEIQNAGGGAFFVDEAYQLTSQHNYGGNQVLDFLLAEMENNVGKVVFILAGYNKEMEKFFEHNPGLKSRVPYTLQFADYEDSELLLMLQRMIKKKYRGRMAIEDGRKGLFMRVAIRRLGRGRGRPGFGNARALQITMAQISERQAARLNRERREGKLPDDFYLAKEDLIGPDPSLAIVKSTAWRKLQDMTGLQSVKESVRNMIDRIKVNYNRELEEIKPIEISLNRCFVGSPGTGKTSVAKLYGQILADLGLLSNGEVVTKNPADFVGNVLGQSESNTKAILASTVGKVLIIDEAYMLYSGAGGTSKPADPFKTAVIDTIVAEVQSVPGEDRCVLLLGYKEQITTMFQNVNPGLSRRFAIENAFHFENFSDEELAKIFSSKLKDQDLDATAEAKAVILDVLRRARNRPNFGNAGEVENQLSLAKDRFQARQSSMKASERSYDMLFEPQDFDPDFNRGASAATNLQQLFKDIVGCEEVIEKLGGYQSMARGLKARGLDPRETVPTNFLFKGPPGTGKTTTARKMGQVFYDMGFLSSIEVIDCSASDLIGQYVGHTGPKTKDQLEKALGKVLFVDEAYRLAEGGFATEAINELVDQLTKPNFKGKLIVILAGYDKDINNLISINPGLSSRFPEEIVFHNMRVEDCLKLLEQELKQKQIEVPPLTGDSTPQKTELVQTLEQLADLPSWGNARDIQTMAKTLIGTVFKAQPSSAEPLRLSFEQINDCARTLLHDRRSRVINTKTAAPINHLPTLGHQPAPRPIDPTIASSVDKSVAHEQRVRKQPPEAEIQSSEDRDDGVSDEVWEQLQADRRAAERDAKTRQDRIISQEKDLQDLRERELQAEARLVEILRCKAKDEAELMERKRKLEEARLREQDARIERGKALAEFERLRKEAQRRKKEDARVQVKLKEMGVCCVGYRWIKQDDGYRCAGGSHFVSSAALGV